MDRFTCKRYCFCVHFVLDLHDIFAFERKFPSKKQKQKDPTAPYIRFLMQNSLESLRRHIIPGSRDLFVLLVKSGGSSKIYNFDRKVKLRISLIHFVQKHYVIQFDIAMNNMLLVQVGKGAEKLLHNVSDHCLRELLHFLDQLDYGPTFAILHHHVVE